MKDGNILNNYGKYWLEADLSQQHKIKMITDTLQHERINILIYNVGMWEKEGFEDHYDFEQDDPEDIATIVNTNITSAITYIQALLPNLRRSESGKIILIGSTAGLDNTNNSSGIFCEF